MGSNSDPLGNSLSYNSRESQPLCLSRKGMLVKQTAHNNTRGQSSPRTLWGTGQSLGICCIRGTASDKAKKGNRPCCSEISHQVTNKHYSATHGQETWLQMLNLYMQENITLRERKLPSSRQGYCLLCSFQVCCPSQVRQQPHGGKAGRQQHVNWHFVRSN